MLTTRWLLRVLKPDIGGVVGCGSQTQAGGAPGQGGVPAGLQHRPARDPGRFAGDLPRARGDF